MLCYETDKRSRTRSKNYIVGPSYMLDFGVARCGIGWLRIGILLYVDALDLKDLSGSKSIRVKFPLTLSSSICIFPRNHNVMKMFSDKGILTEDSPLKVAETSDVVITMLPSSNHVRFAYHFV